MLGDIYLQEEDFESALDEYDNAFNLNMSCIPAIKGMLICYSELRMFEDGLDLADRLRCEDIKDPNVFLGLYQIGYAFIEEVSSQEASEFSTDRVRVLEDKCNTFLNFAFDNSETKDLDFMEQIARNYFQIKNFQIVSQLGHKHFAVSRTTKQLISSVVSSGFRLLQTQKLQFGVQKPSKVPQHRT